MGRVYKPYYKTRAGQRKQCRNWYAEWTNAAGKSQRRKVGPHKATAEAYLVRAQDAATRQRLGLDPAPAAAARVRSLTEWQADYLADLATRDVSDAYPKAAARQLAAVVNGCGWLLWTDIAAADVTRYLARRRAGGNSNATLNTYLNTAKTFGKWVADRLGAPNPLRSLKPYNAEVTRRRSKRVLTDAELAALVAAADRCRGGCRPGSITGPDRAMLYRVAAHTGLRAKELASLTPAAFRLDAEVPVVVVEAKDTKGKREEPVPVPAHLAALLRPWLAGKPAGARLWPGKWAAARLQHEWVKRDVKRAGIAATDARGQTVTFHGLRRTYCTRLIRAGAKVHELRRLARHRDVRTTLNHYTDESMPDLAALADKLPPA